MAQQMITQRRFVYCNTEPTESQLEDEYHVYKWIFEFLKSNRFCEGDWIPEEVMADNSPAISAAVREVFPTAKRRNCKVHVLRAVDDKFKALGIDKATASKIRDQLRELECIAFENQFDVAAAAVIDEWKQSEDVVEFAEYFDWQYVKKDKFWFTANGQGVNNNNSLEATNRWVKVDFITRRMDLMEAVRNLKDWLFKCVEKNYGNPVIKVSNKEWIAADDLRRRPNGGVIFADGSWHVRRSNASQDQFEAILQTMYPDDEILYIDAIDVKEFQKNVAVVTRSTLFDDEFTCNCPIGTLRQHCKHVLLVECICGREWPNIALLRQTIQQAERNGPGRKRGHTRALVVD